MHFQKLDRCYLTAIELDEFTGLPKQPATLIAFKSKVIL